MAWKYIKVEFAGTGTTETNPQEINILAGATQCQIGGTIESTRDPVWSTLPPLIDGNTTTATYWTAGPAPVVTVTLPAERDDLTEIQIFHGWTHAQHKLFISEDKTTWIECPFTGFANAGKQQNFSIPALPIKAETSIEFSRSKKSYAVIEDSYSVFNFLGSITIEFWIKLITPLPNDFQVIIDKGNLSTQQFYVLHEARNGNNQIKYRFGNGPERTLNLSAYVLNKWSHMAFVRFGNNMIFYLDGDLIISESFANTLSTNYSNVTLGKMTISDGGYINAYLDEVRLWSMARTQQQIRDNAKNVDPNTPYLTGYWKMNDATGNIIKGLGEKALDGKLMNGATFSEDIPNAGVVSQNFEQTAQLNFSLTQAATQNYTQISLDFEQAAQLNIGMSEDTAKTYTAKGYNHNRWTLNYLDYYFYGDQSYTPNGYKYEASTSEPTKARYIRDWLGKGSNINPANHWIEIEAYSNGQNVALEKSVTFYGNITGWFGPEVVTDGIQGQFLEINPIEEKAWAQVDLGELVDIEEVKVWHYYGDGRTYFGTKTEISTDGINWTPIFDSTITGEYAENIEGNSINLIVNGLSLSLEQTASQTYTAKGYDFNGADNQEIIFDFGAAQEYTPQGYEFQQSTQENIFVSYVGSQAFTAEGYNRATMAQENILLVSVAAQIYTPIGYHYEATTGQALTSLTQQAAQVFAAHFEQAAQDSVNLVMQAAQIFAAHFENQTQLNFSLDLGASQHYTAIGYTNEMSTSEALELNIGAAQTFAARFERFGTQIITLGMVASAEYQANFIANASDTVFVIDSAAQTVNFSDGLQFQANSQNDFNITFGAAQEFTPFGGYSFNQNSSNDITANAAASLLYEMGEIGKFSQRASLFLSLQESTQTTYTRNWLEFDSNAAENMALSFGATSEHIEAHIFEANAAEGYEWYLGTRQFYGRYFEGTNQENISLSINAASVYTNVFNEYEAAILEPFYLHHTDKSIHEINYLSFTQNMYYDFLFWHYADSLHDVGFKTFASQANEMASLTMAASVQYTNANKLNGFTTENINLTMAAHVEHIEATIYEFNNIATEDIHLDFLAASEHIEATIYEFAQKANESMAMAFGAVSEHIEAHIFTDEIKENINLFYYGFSEYQNINPFAGKAHDLLMFEHWATALNTTEPRNYEALIELNFKLKIVNWVYFESDIYKPTYTLEVEKPDSLWTPTEDDAKEKYVFGRDPITKVDRRILTLTDIREPKKISYEKPNTLYTNTKKEESHYLVDD